MGLFAALMTYLVAAVLLVGSAVAGLSVLFSPSDADAIAKAKPPLVRAAKKPAEPPKATASPQSAAATIPGPVINPVPADPSRANNEARAKQQASQSARKKKAAKPAPPREPASATLGYGPSEPRKFIFPLDPGW